MSFASTNRTKVGYVAETGFGATPASPTFKALRLTSNGLDFEPQTVESAEIRADRQIPDLILVGARVNGDNGIEISFLAWDDFLEAVLMGTWANKPSIAVATADTEISDVSATTLTVASGGAAFKAGMLTLLSGFTTAANNKLARVTSSTGTNIVYPSATFSAEGAAIPVGATVRAVGFEGASGDLATVTSPTNGLTSTVLDFTTLGIAPGERLRIGDTDAANTCFATAGANCWVRVATVAAHLITFDEVEGAAFAADTGTGKTVRVFFGDLVTNGTTKRSFTFEVQQQDVASPTYEYFTGINVAKLSLAAKAAAVMTGSLSLLGKTKTGGTSRLSGAADAAAPAYDVMNTTSHVGRMAAAGTQFAAAGGLMDFSVDVDNNMEALLAIGVLGAADVRAGSFKVTGKLTAYFTDLTLLNYALQNAAFGLVQRLGRPDGNRESYVFELPRVKLSEAKAPSPGKNQSRMVNAGYQAIRHPTLGWTMGIGRFWYLPASAAAA